jgi:hypothetical protein
VRKLQLKILCSLAVFVYAIGTSMVQGSERDNLTGVTAMSVVIEDIAPGFKSAGLDVDVLKTAAELRLRRSGITVGDEDSLPFLHVSIILMPSSDGVVVYGISVAFKQPAIVIANQKHMVAATWARNSVGSVGMNNAYRIRSNVEDDIDAFINDYLAANPKPVKTPANQAE